MEKIMEAILEIKGNTNFLVKLDKGKNLRILEWKRNTQRWWVEQAGETDPDTGEAEITEWEGKELPRDKCNGQSQRSTLRIQVYVGANNMQWFKIAHWVEWGC